MRMVAAWESTASVRMTRLNTTLSFPTAATLSWEYRLSINWSTLGTIICSAVSIKIGTDMENTVHRLRYSS